MLKVVALYIAYTIFMQSLVTIWCMERYGRGARSRNLVNNLYLIAGTIITIVIFTLYWYKVFWYSPICLLGFDLLFGTFIWMIVERALANAAICYVFSLVASPVSAIVCFLIIFPL